MAVKSSRSGQWKKQRLRVLKRDNYVCFYCQGPANEADHIVAKVKGGGDEMENLVSACRMCNLRKGKKNQAVFLGRTTTPLDFPVTLSPVTRSVPLSGPFEGQSEPLWT